jgi:hypothetical protein
MKTKRLSFAFFYFSESGLFSGLRAIQMKKIRLRLGPHPKRLKRYFLILFDGRAGPVFTRTLPL